MTLRRESRIVLDRVTVNKLAEPPTWQREPSEFAPPLAAFHAPDAVFELNAGPPARAWSPIVLAGLVRIVEFALIAAVGMGVYAVYLAPIEGFQWRYVGATGAIGTISPV